MADVKNLDNLIKKENLKCDECGYIGKNIPALKQHLTKFHKIKVMLQCANCDYSTDHKKMLNRHRKAVHLKIKDFVCEFCDYRASERSKLRRHIIINHEAKNLQCPLCEFKTSYKPFLNEHRKFKHEDVKRNYPNFCEQKCEECGKVLKSKANLNIHIKSVHRGLEFKKYKCDMCDFRALQRSHVKKHKKDTPHVERQCKKCPFKCNTTFQMQKHVAKEHKRDPLALDPGTGIKGKESQRPKNKAKNIKAKEEFICDKCDIGLTSKTSLRKHMNKIHTKLICDQCDYRAPSKILLQKHIKGEHKKQRREKNPKCKICQIECETLAALNSHVSTSHKDAFIEIDHQHHHLGQALK